MSLFISLNYTVDILIPEKAFFSQGTLMMKCFGLMKLLEISMVYTFIIVPHVHVEIGDTQYRMSFNSTIIGEKLI